MGKAKHDITSLRPSTFIAKVVHNRLHKKGKMDTKHNHGKDQGKQSSSDMERGYTK